MQVVLEGSLGGDGLYSFKSIPLSQQPAFQTTKVCPSLPNLPNPAPSVHTSVSASVQSSSEDVVDPILWHSHLGHVNFQTVKVVMKLCDIPITKFNNVDLFCKACCLGKSQRILSPPSFTQHNTPFKFIHTNLWGSSPTPSSCGYTYYITFVDATTRFTWIYFLKFKTEALTTFVQFQQTHPNSFFYYH